MPHLEYHAGQIPLKRIGTAEEAAALALFLASDNAAYVSSIAVPIDGGASGPARRAPPDP